MSTGLSAELRRRRLIGVIMVLAAAICFASMPTFAKISYEYGANPVGLLTARYLFGGLCLILFLFLRRRLNPLGRQHLVAVLLAVILCVQSFSFFRSLELTSTVVAVLLLYTYPLIVTIVSTVLFGERADRNTYLVLALGLIGVGLSLGTNFDDLSIPGALFALNSGILFAVFLMISKRSMEGKGLGPIETVAYLYLVCAAIYLVVFGLLDGQLPTGRTGLLGLFGVIAIGTIGSMTLFYLGLERLPAGITSMLSTLEPAVSVLLAAIFLGEAVSLQQVAGIALVLAALAALGFLVLKREPN